MRLSKRPYFRRTRKGYTLVVPKSIWTRMAAPKKKKRQDW